MIGYSYLAIAEGDQNSKSFFAHESLRFLYITPIHHWLDWKKKEGGGQTHDNQRVFLQTYLYTIITFLGIARKEENNENDTIIPEV